jgi:hypothetical protein
MEFGYEGKKGTTLKNIGLTLRPRGAEFLATKKHPACGITK